MALTFTEIGPGTASSCELRDGVKMPCPGLSPGQIGRLIKRFPDIEQMIEEDEPSMLRMLDCSDEAIAATIASGFGFEGDRGQEKAIHDNLLPAEKIVALKTIWEVSIDPLTEALADMRRRAEARMRAGGPPDLRAAPSAPASASSSKSKKRRSS
jgi:hypothetical protein